MAVTNDNGSVKTTWEAELFFQAPTLFTGRMAGMPTAPRHSWGARGHYRAASARPRLSRMASNTVIPTGGERSEPKWRDLLSCPIGKNRSLDCAALRAASLGMTGKFSYAIALRSDRCQRRVGGLVWSALGQSQWRPSSRSEPLSAPQTPGS